MQQSILAVIPARGGSKGIPRKNARFLAGKPLLAYAIHNARHSAWITDVVVSTDDEELARIARLYGAEVVDRPAEFALDAVPLDPVIHHATEVAEARRGAAYDAVVTLQPTSPLLRGETLDKALAEFFAGDADTMLSAVDDRHLSWTQEGDVFVPMYAARVNRQYLPANFRETGGFLVARRAAVTAHSRIGAKVSLFEVPGREAIDIDTPVDWWIAEKLLRQRRIILRVDGYSTIGLGHVYRMLLLAERLIDHEFVFVTSAAHSLGQQVITARHYPQRVVADDAEWRALVAEYRPDVVINDLLDTEAPGVEWLRAQGIFVVSFEDMGPGARVADLVINALYEEPVPHQNHVWGPAYYCLRDEFRVTPPKEITDAVSEVLVTFGGTDANDLTSRLLPLIRQALGEVVITVITGPGYAHRAHLEETVAAVGGAVQVLTDIKTISHYMHRADLVLTSAGRTVYEVASIGTPVVVLAQNSRELTHTFARAENGIVNLGLGTGVADALIVETLQELAGDPALRARCAARMRAHDLRGGIDTVIDLIFRRYDARSDP